MNDKESISKERNFNTDKTLLIQNLIKNQFNDLMEHCEALAKNICYLTAGNLIFDKFAAKTLVNYEKEFCELCKNIEVNILLLDALKNISKTKEINNADTQNESKQPTGI